MSEQHSALDEIVDAALFDSPLGAGDRALFWRIALMYAMDAAHGAGVTVSRAEMARAFCQFEPESDPYLKPLSVPIDAPTSSTFAT